MKQLVLVGAGHAHLHTLAQTGEFVKHGAQVTLIAPGKFWYSGMGPGMLSQFYEPADDTVDVGRLVEGGGGRFICAEVAKIEAGQRELHLENGARVPYDLLSLNVGSEVPLEEIEGAVGRGLPVKPIKNLLHLRERVLERKGELAIVVLGGGAAGTEVALNLWHLMRQAKRPQKITIVSASARLLPGATPKASRILASYLQELGIAIELGSKAQRVCDRELELEGGRRINYAELVIAIGIRAPRILRESALLCAPDGSMRVNQFLQCVDHPEIFGAGDCVWFGKAGLPRVGVYAVRQGVVLQKNLLAALTGEPLQKFRPQKRYLLILNLGDGTGLLTRGPWAVRARWAFWLKDWLDRRFVRRFQLPSTRGHRNRVE